MALTSEEIQLIEQAVKNEIQNLNCVIERLEVYGKHQEWVIKKRRLEIAMRELRNCSCTLSNNWRYD